jgi:tetratricopeptide (TPR) repeat protein
MPPFYWRLPPIYMRTTAIGLLALFLGMSLLPGGPGTARADDANAAKARELVRTAINMTDSDQAVKLLWQATDLDPAFEEPYVYLGLYYNSRSDFAQVVQVYKKLAKYEPQQATVYLNIGEAYMSFSPAQLDNALQYYRKAYSLDPKSSFAALRIGEVLAQQGKRDDAIKYLHQAASDSSHNPTAAAEAQKILSQLGSS